MLKIKLKKKSIKTNLEKPESTNLTYKIHNLSHEIEITSYKINQNKL